jgi:hypothetical protein
MIIRKLWSSSEDGTGMLAASLGISESVGLAVQLATQCSLWCWGTLAAADGE